MKESKNLKKACKRFMNNWEVRGNMEALLDWDILITIKWILENLKNPKLIHKSRPLKILTKVRIHTSLLATMVENLVVLQMFVESNKWIIQGKYLLMANVTNTTCLVIKLMSADLEKSIQHMLKKLLDTIMSAIINLRNLESKFHLWGILTNRWTTWEAKLLIWLRVSNIEKKNA